MTDTMTSQNTDLSSWDTLHDAGYSFESQLLCVLPASCWFLAWLFLDTDDGGDIPPKRGLTFSMLHGVISQKIRLFITIAVTSSNLISVHLAQITQRISIKFGIDGYADMCGQFRFY
jgi:hypothetical protein